jgi:predicted ATPase
VLPRPCASLELVDYEPSVATGEAQFVIATHSPILLAYPGSLIYELSQTGIEAVKCEDSFICGLYRGFLSSPSTFLRHLGFGAEEHGEG